MPLRRLAVITGAYPLESLMAPEQVKLAAIILALVSVILFLGAAIVWGNRGAVASPEPPGRGAGRGAAILVTVSLLVLGGLWGLAEPAGWGRDRTLWVGFGGFLAVMTLTRPWWFWENHRARWLRALIGDEPTALLYMLLAGVMAWVGLFTDWTFGRR